MAQDRLSSLVHRRLDNAELSLDQVASRLGRPLARLAGQQLLNRFVHELCGCERLWTPANIIEDAIARVRAQVGSSHVLLGLSGGVACYKAAELCRALTKAGASVQVVMTDFSKQEPEQLE